jgi:hypothetical protein
MGFFTRRRFKAGYSDFFGGTMKSKAFDYDLQRYPNWIDPADVVPYERNSKKHDERQIKNIVNSINRFGWQQDTVLTLDFVCVVGHGRREAALKIGCKMPYHFVAKTADELTEEDIRELRNADNLTNAMTGFDADMLKADFAELDFDGFDFELEEFGVEDLPGGDSDTYTGQGATEYSEEDFGDDKFNCECPRCGFRFNP